MTDFPRGYTLTSFPPSGTIPTITLPAIPGIAHVIDAFEASVIGSAASSSNHVQINSASLGTIIIGYLAAPMNELATDSATGLGIVGSPGESVTIALDAAAAGYTEFLRIQGYDI